MTYVYLNTYANGYLYVGSHTWDGPEGELDPNYHGSSGVAQYKGWIPVKEEILEVVSEDRKFIAERYWIEKYAELYGIADCAAMFARSKGWVCKFKQHGLLLNAHANNCAQAIVSSHSAEAIKARKDSGGYNFRMTQCHSKEAREKSVKSRIDNGAIAKWIASAHTPEINRKRADARKLTARKVIGTDGYIGCASMIAEHYGTTRNSASNIVCRTYKMGSYIWRGIEFKIYEEKLYK